MRKTSCGIILVANHQILLVKPTNGSYWDFPKGCADEGEEHLDAAIRECKEETNFDLAPYRVNIKEDVKGYYNREKHLHLFRLDIKDSIDLQKFQCNSFVEKPSERFPEIESCQLFDYSEFIQMIKSEHPTETLCKTMQNFFRKAFLNGYTFPLEYKNKLRIH